MPQPLGLYVHVPFCERKCAYCDFYTVQRATPPFARFVDTLLVELARWGEVRRRRLDTVFVGGGTPTELPPAELARLLSAVSSHLVSPSAPTDGQPEVTVEANPETLTPERVDTLARGGVTRLSMGAQSFDPAELATLTRTHRISQIEHGMRLAREGGIGQINLDLIFGIPGQSLANWTANLRRAIELGPDHLSCYALTYEHGTGLTRRRDAGLIRPCDEELEAEMFEAAIDILRAAGYEHYEISNFARPGARCRHNVNTWRYREYVGIGPAAAGHLDGKRWRNLPDMDAWMRAIEQGSTARCDEEQLSPPDQLGERAMLGLRMIEGIDVSAFRMEMGVDPLSHFAAPIAEYAARGWLELADGAIRLTRAGLLLADRVAAGFLAAQAPTPSSA